MKINLKNIAFTMAEMMMVMAIIGATAALTILDSLCDLDFITQETLGITF